MDSPSDGDTLTYVVPQPILAKSARLLRRLSKGRWESVVLWKGTQQGRRVMVQQIIVPHHQASLEHFDVPFEERLRIIRELAESGEKLIAQLHTHPGRAFHSRTDDRLALPRHTGAVSIVVPEFSARWQGNLLDVSVNLHLGGGVWTELNARAVAAAFEVL